MFWFLYAHVQLIHFKRISIIYDYAVSKFIKLNLYAVAFVFFCHFLFPFRFRSLFPPVYLINPTCLLIISICSSFF